MNKKIKAAIAIICLSDAEQHGELKDEDVKRLRAMSEALTKTTLFEDKIPDTVLINECLTWISEYVEGCESNECQKLNA